jgi:hypothetical protein
MNPEDSEDAWVTAPFSRQNHLHVNLRDLEHELRCKICGDLYRNPVSLNTCQHSFCAECLRSTLTEQTTRLRNGGATCPECRDPLENKHKHEHNYRPNRSLSRLVALFAGLREPLHQTLVQAAGGARALAAPEASADNCDDESNQEAIPEEIPDAAAHTTATRPRRGTKRPAAEPIAPPTIAHKLQPKRRIIYSSYRKRKELQDLCRGEGLSIEGTEQELKLRHQRFVNFWNAHTDNLDGSRLSAKQVRHLFGKEESQRQQQAYEMTRDRSKLDTLFQPAHANLPSGAGTGNPPPSAFQTQVKHNFRDMIAQVRMREQSRRNKTTSSSNEEPPIEETHSQQASPAKEEARFADGEEVSSRLQDGGETFEKGIGMEDQDTQAPGETDETDESLGSVVSCDILRKKITDYQTQDAPPTNHDTLPVLDEASWSSSERNISPREPRPAPVFCRRLSRGGSLVGPWNCPACTLINKTNTWSTAKCEACGTQRPKPNPLQDTISIDGAR